MLTPVFYYHSQSANDRVLLKHFCEKSVYSHQTRAIDQQPLQVQELQALADQLELDLIDMVDINALPGASIKIIKEGKLEKALQEVTSRPEALRTPIIVKGNDCNLVVDKFDIDHITSYQL